MSRCFYYGPKDTLNGLQYTVLRQLPFYISWIAELDSLIRRQLILTLDDIMWFSLMIAIEECSKLLPPQTETMTSNLDTKTDKDPVDGNTTSA